MQFIYVISFNFYGIGNEMFNSPTFWWLLLLVPSFSGLLELAVQLVGIPAHSIPFHSCPRSSSLALC